MFNLTIPPMPFERAVASVVDGLRQREARMEEIANQVANIWAAKADRLDSIINRRGKMT